MPSGTLVKAATADDANNNTVKVKIQPYVSVATTCTCGTLNPPSGS